MEIELNALFFAFGLTLFAGLATGIGSFIAYLTKHTNKKFLSIALGFSAGVMIFIALVELYPQSINEFRSLYAEKQATLFTILSFFGGILLIGVIDKLIPSYENPHEVKSIESMHESKAGGHDKKLLRMGVMSALAIAIHNFPEGMATFVSGLTNLEVAIPIAIAIAIHNIPEGIAVSVPIYFATGNRKKALLYSFLSGLAEPTGAIVGFCLVYFLFGINAAVLGVFWGLAAGIMIFISLDELLPNAKAYGKHHHSMYGLVAGMAVMALSLWVL